MINQEVANLEPKEVWQLFEALNEVPRPSKKEERVIAYTKAFGEKLGLETIVDEAGNVIIRKPATAGMEDRKTVVFQSHLDMVHQKNADVDFDFDTEGIRSYIDGDWVTAEGTTLGADNGMGAAAAMAVLASTDIPHGPIEALFTIDEETGMTGAFALKGGLLHADIMMNLDSEDEGELYIGCAGGIDTNVSMDYKEEATTTNYNAYNIAITGLKGGHSGMEIILQRGNSNILMNRLQWMAARQFKLRVVSNDGGSLRNAIPREAFSTVVVPKENHDAFLKFVAEYTEIIKTEFSKSDPALQLEIKSAELPANMMIKEDQDAILNAIYACPNGVVKMSDSVKDLVETSSNLARIIIKDGKFIAQALQRSSVEPGKEDLANKIRACFELAGATVEHSGSYPGWQPNMDSPILKTMLSVYEENYGKVPEIKAIHAGLECGILGRNYPDMDMISFGPTIRNPHSPDEKVNIETVAKFWDFLKKSLLHVPVK